MARQKRFIRIFTSADYIERENWLREKHNEGWKLVQVLFPCTYIMEETEEKDVIYRLDYNTNENSEYLNLMKDYGWERVTDHNGWIYFRKDAVDCENKQDEEIYSDDNSRLEMVKEVTNKKILPLGLLLFIMAGLFIFFRVQNGKLGFSFTYIEELISYGIGYLIWFYIFFHSLFKLRRRKKELEHKDKVSRKENTSTKNITKVIVIILVIRLFMYFVTLGFEIFGGSHVNKISIDNVEKIVIVIPGREDNLSIDDDEKINEISNMIFDKEYKKMAASPYEIKYILSFYDENNVLIHDIGILSDGSIGYDKHNYKCEDGGKVDLSYFETLLN